MTLKIFFEAWIARRLGLRQITDTSAQGYATIARPLLAALGDRALASITRADIEALYVARLRDVSPATLRGLHNLLNALFNAALDDELIAASPMRKVAAPQGKAKERKALDQAHVKKLLAYAADKPLLDLVVRLAIATGMRRGELCALRWRDVDLDAGLIHVARTIVRVGKVERESAPKSEAGVRSIALPADLLAVLRARAGRPDEPVLMTAQRGRPSLAYTSELLKSALRAIGLDEGYCLHSTRHTHATHLLKRKMPVKAVSQRLGHADVAVTLKVYAKTLNGDDAELAAAINDVLAA